MDNLIFQTKDLSFESNGKMILKNISFDVYEKEQITIAGPSGSGKSTLLKLLGSMLTPTSGEIYYKNKLQTDYPPVEYRKEVSYFFQNAQLFDQTVRDNLSFPYEIRNETFNEETVLQSLDYVQLPKSYLDKPVKELSGGEKQRIAFIRNLQFPPKVLLLDEVTSSLDQENREVILKLIEQLNQESTMTILMVTHNMAEIEQSGRVLTLQNGRMKQNDG